MDYEKLHKDTITKLQEMVNSGKITVEIARGICADFVPESDDERIRQFLIQEVTETSDEIMSYRNMNKEDVLAWLEKQGEQPNKVSIWKHWKDGIAGNGEGKLVYLVKVGNTYRLTSSLAFECDYIELSELDSFMFEKQGEQKPVEWSEEDKAIIDYLLQLINNSHKEPCTKGLIAFGAEAWLKSLKGRVQPQNTWKPSDEQIECLSDAIEHYNSLGYPATTLKELLNNLLKLREE